MKKKLKSKNNTKLHENKTNQKNVENNINQHFKSLHNQREYMDNLYSKLKLKYFDDFYKISQKKIISNGGYSLIISHYSKDIKKLLTEVYPNYPWNLHYFPVQKSANLADIDTQLEFLEKIYHKLEMTSLDDWYKVSKTKICSRRGLFASLLLLFK